MNKKICFFILFSMVRILSSYAATYTVTNAGDAGPGSFRQAIIDANTNPGLDTISFTGPFSITLSTRLPDITSPVFIDGPVATGPQIEVNGTTNAVAGAGMLLAAPATGSVIKGLNIHGHSGQGILIAASDVTVIGCFIGTDITGSIDRGNGASGIEIAAGLTTILIGGSSTDSANVVSGNNALGINIAAGCSNVRIAGNKVGVSADGNSALGNSALGILSGSVTNLIIGGTGTFERNIISSNGQIGIGVNNASSVIIAGNFIGVDGDGTDPLPNGQHGISLTSCTNSFIGTGIAGAKNVISNNGAHGILLDNSTNITIRGNYIGTDVGGTIQLGNTSHGIQLQGNMSGIIIGGKRFTEGNLISSNGGAGINFQDAGTGKVNANGTIIKGNLIGTDFTATQNFGNNVIGIILKSDNCIIGDTTNEEGNVIVGTKIFCGLLIANGNSNIVRGNYIGVGLNGTTAIPNNQDGITLAVENAGQTATNNLIQYNTIAYNTRHGVNAGLALGGSPFINNNETGNTIRLNSMYCNGGLGIFLNLTNAADHGNNGNTAPRIDFVNSTSNIVVGITDPALAGEKIDLYLVVDCPSCDVNPQGKILIDSTLADGAGNWSYDYFAEFGVPIPGEITATATDLSGNTSQFSVCCFATVGTSLVSSDNIVCPGEIFTITYSNGQQGDSLMLQTSPTGLSGSWVNYRREELADPITFNGVSILDTTFFRVVTFSQGAFQSAQCKDSSAVIEVDLALVPVGGTAVISSDSICSGQSVTLTLSGHTGNIQWQHSLAGGGFTSISGATTTPLIQSPTSATGFVLYRAIVSNGICPEDTSNVVSVKVIEINSGSISGPSEVCNGEAAQLSLTGFIGSVQWQDSLSGMSWISIPGATAPGIVYTPSAVVAIDFVRVVVTDTTGTCATKIAATFAVSSDTCLAAQPIALPNALTPNGDGNNDVFYIGNIDLYPNNRLTIFNRWGNKVYEAQGYLNQWDGTRGGEDLPVATYYYVLELGKDIHENMNAVNEYTGFVTIVR